MVKEIRNVVMATKYSDVISQSESLTATPTALYLILL